jgi:hypothetical protein
MTWQRAAGMAWARGVWCGEAAGRRVKSVAFHEVSFRWLELDSVYTGVERIPVLSACRVTDV